MTVATGRGAAFHLAPDGPFVATTLYLDARPLGPYAAHRKGGPRRGRTDPLARVTVDSIRVGPVEQLAVPEVPGTVFAPGGYAGACFAGRAAASITVRVLVGPDRPVLRVATRQGHRRTRWWADARPLVVVVTVGGYA